MNSYKNPPEFNSKIKPFDRYIEELKGWCIVTDLEKKKQGIAIALSMPEDDPSGVRDKIFNDISLADLNKDNGVNLLIEYMNKLFKKDELSDVYERYIHFDRYNRESNQKMEDFVLEFEKRYNRIKQKEMVLPNSVLAFKILDSSGLSHRDRQLVLTGVDYSNKATMYEQMKSSLKKFHGEQAIPQSNITDKSIVKVECNSEDQNVLYNNSRPYARRGGGRGMSYGNRYRGANRYSTQNKREKPTNPLGFNGKPIRCKICESIMHLMRDCPDSDPNGKFHEAFETSSAEPVVLFTGAMKDDMCLLSYEARNAAVLDSGCSSTVAGQKWIQCYIDSLSEKDKINIKRMPGKKVFKFGGGESKTSLEQVELPAIIADKPVTITTDVVDSEIPLLLSKDAMKKAKIKLDLENDKAVIFDKEINLDSTTCGHYCIPIIGSSVSVNDCLIAQEQCSNNTQKEHQLLKIHKQFAHPTYDRMKALLVDAKFWDNDCQEIMQNIYKKCNTCMKFKRTPSRPVVSLPLATKFNETVTMDLKHWKDNLYIFYLIDMFSRYTKAEWIKSKDPEIIVDKIFSMWIGAGLGTPEKFLADNGGEFGNYIFRDMSENLNVHVLNTAAFSPWQNGLCERNHAVVDRCLEKIVEDTPNISLKIALAWALNAKNSLQMHSGFSSYQIVFGQQPNLPSVMSDKPPALYGTTSSSKIAEHLNTMHATRKAYIEAESAERIRRALRNKIRSNSQYFSTGDKVYYKRQDSNKWKGPGIVIGQDGKVILIRHGSIYVRVSSSRILKAGEEFQNDPIDAEIDKNIKSLPSTSKGNIIDSDSENDKVNTESVNNDDGHIDPPQPILSNISTYPKSKDMIMYKVPDDDIRREGKIIGRAGKAGGKYSSWFNIQTPEGELSLDLDAVEWQFKEAPNNAAEVNIVIVPKSRHHETEVIKAKQKELQNWSEFQVFSEVKDRGQSTISTTWVITEKIVEGEKITKARLVARGFEEDLSSNVDSPTASKSTMRIFFAIAGIKQWKCKSIDIKSAFLQGRNIDREVYLQPPPEEQQEGKIWKLNKVVYGLNDAARNWYLSVVDELLKLGCIQSKFDKALFYYYHDKNLDGIFQIHVDDFIHAGTNIFHDKIISKLESVFKIGKMEESDFKYIGLNINQKGQPIVVNQKVFIEQLEPIPISFKRANRKFEPLNRIEMKQFRTAVGQINWIASTSRPDVMFDMLELSMSLKQATVQDLLHANKVIKTIKLQSYSLTYPVIDSIENLKLIVYTDASFANLPDKISSAGGYIVILTGESNKGCLLSWSSSKIKRVVKSTSAAETLALLTGIEEAIYLQAILSELLSKNQCKIPIEVFIDSKNIHSAIHSTKTVTEKRLRLDIAAIKEMLNNKEIVKVNWIQSNQQMADCMSKRGASTSKLLQFMETGCIKEIDV